MPLSRRSQRVRLPPEGFPGHVRGWCVKAGTGTMKRGYRDVGYLFAPHIRQFKPATILAWSWPRRLRALAISIESRNPADVEQWFHRHYPQLMELIPRSWHEALAVGVIERVAELTDGGKE